MNLKKTLPIIVILITELMFFGSVYCLENNNKILNSADFEFDNTGNILFHHKGFEQSFPAFELNSNNYLVLNFDVFGHNNSTLYYIVYQWNADWTKRNINVQEYLAGFNLNNIENFKTSYNTSFDYTNYQLQIPNNDIDLLQSGNYTVHVYNDAMGKDLLLSRRFVVFSNNTYIAGGGDAFKNTQGGLQFVNLDIDYSALPVTYADEELNISYLVNGDWNTFKGHNKFRSTANGTLLMEYGNALSFQGGSEYRYFDNRNFKQKSERVDYIEFKPPYYHFHLKEDNTRDFREYFYEEDINGNYIPEQDDMWGDKHIEADYTYVHFYLKTSQPLLTRLYVYGGLTKWKFNEQNELMYLPNEQVYTGKLILKQGYYNYRYVAKDYGSKHVDWSTIEGSHAQTENQVHVFVYYKTPNSDFERLAGYKVLSTMVR